MKARETKSGSMSNETFCTFSKIRGFCRMLTRFCFVVLTGMAVSSLTAQVLTRSLDPTNSASPYGIPNLDPDIVSPGYEYCRFGNLMSEGAASGSDRSFSITPFSGTTPESFLLNRHFLLNQLSGTSVAFLSGRTGFPSIPRFSSFWDGTLGGFHWIRVDSPTVPFTNGVLMRDFNLPSRLFNEIWGGPIISSATKKAVVLIHGWNPSSQMNGYSGDEFSALSEALKRILSGTEWSLIHYRWEMDADTGPKLDLDAVQGINGAEAAETGRWHGYHLGELIDRQTDQQIEKVHFIAHSAGTWVARSAIKYLLSARANSPLAPGVKVQLTLLDPFIPSVLCRRDGDRESALSPQLINQITASYGASNHSIYRLENYYTRDVSGASTEALFSWRSPTIDENGFNVEGNAIIAHPYGSHQGPLLFYADTVEVSTLGYSAPSIIWTRLASANPSLRLENEDSLNIWGWRRSMFYREPVVVKHPEAPPTAVAVGSSVPFTAGAVLRGNRQPSVYLAPDPNGADLTGQMDIFLRGWVCKKA